MRYNVKGELLTEESSFYKEYATYYEAHYACSTCRYAFSVVSEKKPRGKSPDCPQCARMTASKALDVTKGRLKTPEELKKNSQKIISSGKFPSIKGDNNAYKAHDATMQMVMEDYGLTDINDKPYEGENCVPKLPAHLEKQVNEGFGASFGDVPKLASNINPATISSVGMQQINSGKFRSQGDVVAMQQQYGPKPKFKFINE